jgi:hypothetical protein
MMDDGELANLTAQSSSSTGLAARRASIIPASSSDHHQEYWQAAIFKVGDDVRQVCRHILSHYVLNFFAKVSGLLFHE